MTYNYSSKDYSIEDLKALRIKSDKGDAESQYLLANYYEGIHLKKSISKAVFHLKTANRENDHRSAQDLLMMLEA